MPWPAFTLFILQLCSLSASAQQADPADILDINPAGRQLTDRLGSLIEWQDYQTGTATTDADQSISLKNRQYARVLLKSPLTGRQGSLSLWIKPDWNPAEAVSHTLLTLPWQDGRNGYMALSMGWWEPEYAKKLIFIVNNEESIACHTDSQLMQKTWNMITVVWDHNKGCRLFIDGDPLAERNLPFNGSYRSANTLLVGSDKGSTVARNRTADFSLGQLAIWSKPLTDNQIHALYQTQSARHPGLAAEKAAWFTPPSRTAPVPTVQNRALFDESAEWALSEAHMQKLLDRMQKAGLNIYIPNVWHGHGTHYPTTITYMAPAVQKISRSVDPLLRLIQAAHARGIEVHPWFTVVRREDDKMPRYYAKGVPDLAYDVHNADFRRFIADLMLDMVRRYPVDGINLDYIRAMGICNSISCQQNYALTTGRKLTDDLAAMNRDQKAGNAIREWQDIAVTDIVERLATGARKIKPNLVISVDGEPQPDPAKRNLEGRNELTWAKTGLIDLIFNMDYRPRPDVEKINTLMTQPGIQNKIIQIFGNYDRRDGKVIPRAGHLIEGYGNYASARWGSNGLGIYLAAAFTEEQADALGKGPFRTPAKTAWSASRH